MAQRVSLWRAPVEEAGGWEQPWGGTQGARAEVSQSHPVHVIWTELPPPIVAPASGQVKLTVVSEDKLPSQWDVVA